MEKAWDLFQNWIGIDPKKAKQLSNESNENDNNDTGQSPTLDSLKKIKSLNSDTKLREKNILKKTLINFY